MEGVPDEIDECRKYVLWVFRISMVITVAIIITTGIISDKYMSNAVDDFNTNRDRLGQRFDAGNRCKRVLNTTTDICNMLCNTIFDKVDNDSIPRICTSTYLYYNIYSIVFIPDCVNLFMGLGLPVADTRPLESFADYNTSHNMNIIMLPLFCFAFVVQVIVYCGIRLRRPISISN